ncbi:MAG: DUF3696 domain-containing protein [Muribaculaceae bacterium]|nr:DUF3696 domain-containing protein [Muribaculaceae bacterium]
METVRIENFKCIEELDLQLGKITVLTGANSSGKTSVVQALLLLRMMISKTRLSADGEEMSVGCPPVLGVPAFDDIVRRGADTITISGDFGRLVMTPGEKTGNLQRYEGSSRVPVWMEAEDFVFLEAERIGPRWQSDLNPDAGKYCGAHGEFTANRLLDISVKFPKVSPARLCPGTATDNFQIQTDAWMSYIFGDVSLKSQPLSDKIAQITLRQPMGWFAASAAGFGYVYALPIILDGLTIPEGAMMVVENPEAHLHPKAQSNIGFFLGTLAAAGVRVVVETHSEHVVNGIRRAALSGIGLRPEEMSIYFFAETSEKADPIRITMDDEGELSDFPVDFFDQVRQDMKEMWRLVEQRGNIAESATEDLPDSNER